MSFTFEATLDPVLEDVKAKLQAKAGGVLNAFHAIDKDNSGQLSTAEFVQILKDFGIVLPPRQLRSLIARFDANGDGTVSIPEFSAYMSGNAGAMEALATAEAVADDSPLPPPGSTMPPSAFGRAPRPPPQGARPLTTMDQLFLGRMENDIEDRRRTSFLTELQKDPRFKPSMLEPPKPRFQTVSVGGGPIVKSHAHWKTGLERRRPYQWGPLGGFY